MSNLRADPSTFRRWTTLSLELAPRTTFTLKSLNKTNNVPPRQQKAQWTVDKRRCKKCMTKPECAAVRVWPRTLTLTLLEPSLGLIPRDRLPFGEQISTDTLHRKVRAWFEPTLTQMVVPSRTLRNSHGAHLQSTKNAAIIRQFAAFTRHIKFYILLSAVTDMVTIVVVILLI
jgi:hypothetical protein